MNYGSIIRFLGALCAFLGATMIFPLAWAVGLAERQAVYGLVVSIGICWLAGAAMFFAGRSGREGLMRREGLAVVGLGWLLAAVAGALPYLLSGAIRQPIDAIFESMSGFTTTGSSILDDLESLPRSLLFWRDFTHWLGGMGIIVLFIAILPHIGVGARHLFRSEIPGAVKEAVTPRIKDTALFLWAAYSILTVLEVGLLRLAGMGWLEAFGQTFGTMATGGFSTRQASIGAFDDAYVELIIIVFMILAGTNFALYRAMIPTGTKFRLRRALAQVHWLILPRNPEWRAYLGVLWVASSLVAVDLVLAGHAPTVAQGVRCAVFQVVSIGTTTGYTTADFDHWPSFSRLVILALMFIGGCSGSTAGSMKVLRVVILVKFGWSAVQKIFRPQAVTTMRLGDLVLRDDVVREILAFFVLFLAIFLAASLGLAAMGLDLESAISAAAANLGNVGPGLGSVGAAETYSGVPSAGKILLTVCMLLGRLEVYTILVLCSPAFWRR